MQNDGKVEGNKAKERLRRLNGSAHVLRRKPQGETKKTAGGNWILLRRSFASAEAVDGSSEQQPNETTPPHNFELLLVVSTYYCT